MYFVIVPILDQESSRSWRVSVVLNMLQWWWHLFDPYSGHTLLHSLDYEAEDHDDIGERWCLDFDDDANYNDDNDGDSNGNDDNMMRLQGYGELMCLVAGDWGDCSTDLHNLVQTCAESRVEHLCRSTGRPELEGQLSVIIGQYRRLLSTCIIVRLQSPKNLGCVSALLTGKFLRVRKVFARIYKIGH